ncbi:MAG: hypothetical protein JRF33_06595 [Deltaproteobacteria bacterium]|nr:hypothetical protein [Deltaproteobacteria bacterium]
MNEFKEIFALAEDRQQALDRLVPGTEEHDYYTCLLMQQRGELDKVDQRLAAWIDREGDSDLAEMIERRQLLLKLEDRNPEYAKRLSEELDLEHDHQPEAQEATAKLSSNLDPAAVSEEAFLREALLRHSDLSSVQNRAMENLLDRDLPTEQLRDLLRRLKRPDHPRLVERILEELADKHSGDFGSFNIHRNLLPEQLTALKKQRPKLSESDAFVRAELRAVLPEEDEDLETDDEARLAYLKRLDHVVADLAPAFNGLKLCVAYHRLVLDQRMGKNDRARFEAYMELPRQAAYVNPNYLDRKNHRRHLAQMGKDFRPDLALGPVRDDWKLVQDLLALFLCEAKDFEGLDRLVEEYRLMRIMAEAKLLAGRPDAQRWVTKLNDPAFIKQVNERVSLDFAPTNPRFFSADQEVTLDLDVKNVETLLVKVFEIHSLNYFLAHGREADTGMDLDGLLATEEQTHRYEEAPARKVRRRFNFPSLKRPGVFVIEFIGNGRSSRALIRKGQLRMLERVGAAGHVMAVLDEKGKHLPGASLWMEGREHKAGDDGFIRLPFAESRSTRDVLLRHDELSQMARFTHQEERYSLHAGFYLDRESLLTRQQAELLIRPMLCVAGIPVPLDLLEEVKLQITSTDGQGHTVQQDVKDLKLHHDAETVHSFRVPAGLRSIKATLSAEVRNITAGRDKALSAHSTFHLNGIDESDRIEDIHLTNNAEGWRLELLGKTGEARSQQPVNLQVVHKSTRLEMHFSLKSDDSGQVMLGALEGIESIQAEGPSGSDASWELPSDNPGLPSSLHLFAGQDFLLPCPWARPDGKTDSFSLLRTLRDRPSQDKRDHLRLTEGALQIQALPAGSYLLTIKEADLQVRLRVIDGPKLLGWILGKREMIESGPETYLGIREVKESPEGWRVQLDGHNANTRLHAFGSRYLPAHNLCARLGGLPWPGLRSQGLTKPEARYLTGRDIGDEMRYVLDRRDLMQPIGCMLDRPGLLLHPWPVRSTDTSLDEAVSGGEFAALAEPAPRMSRSAPSPKSLSLADATSDFANLDFLKKPAATALNLKPDSQGRVLIPREGFEQVQMLRLVACNEQQFVMRHLSLAAQAIDARDLRLADGLDPRLHLCQRRQTRPLAPGEQLRIADITAARVELVDSLAKLYRLFGSLNEDDKLEQFAFITRWPDLPIEEKQELACEHACHELHMFLAKKDPDFFGSHVLPALAHKKQKTFIDRYLLKEDLSDQLEPWAFARLNAAERILLAQRIPEARGDILRHIEDLFELLPPDPEGEQRLLETALGASGMEESDDLGMDQAQEAARKHKGSGRARKAKKAMAPAKMMRAMAPQGMAGGMPPEPEMNFSMDEEMDEEMDEKMDDMDCLMEISKEEMVMPAESMAFGGARADLDRREEMKPMFRQQDKTQEWAESHYHHLSLAEQGPDLIQVNAFWRDFARHLLQPENKTFLSPKVLWAHDNFSEMMLALALTDLPFRPEQHQVDYEGLSMNLTAGSPALAFFEQIEEAGEPEDGPPVLINQNIFRADDRVRYEDGEPVEKPVSGALIKHVVYLCQVVLTNPGSARQKLELLMQIPQGAMPLNSGFVTRGSPIRLDPHETRAIEYSFCFPMAGDFSHFPAHITRNSALVAAAEGKTIMVLDKAEDLDMDSWPWLSQYASPKELLDYLKEANLSRLDLERMAWRMRDRDFFDKTLELLERRKIFTSELWAYGLYHNDQQSSRQWLLHEIDEVLDSDHLFLKAPWFELQGERMGRYEHLEYHPLINARAHPLGQDMKILNNRFDEQYNNLMTFLCQKEQPEAADWMAVACYLLLQERIDEARQAFAKVKVEDLAIRLQYDYLALVFAFHAGDIKAARKLAAPHQDNPVDRWRKRFQAAWTQLDELEGAESHQVDEDHRNQRQTRLADKEPGFDFNVEGGEIHLTHQNLKSCMIHYFGVDIEILFSRQPFVQDSASRFSFIRPAKTDTLSLDTPTGEQTIPLPEDYQRSNVVIEIEAGGRRQAHAHYANNLRLHLTEAYGQLKVLNRETKTALPGCYVKVYARMQNGSERFYKDGYTDLRGKFDYASLSTDDLDQVERFALLVLDDEQGAVVREATPPTR